MLQRAIIGFPDLVGSNQLLPLTACLPSLAFISLHESVGSSGIESTGTRITGDCHETH